MKKYTVQRPAIIWLETTVQANSLTEALELGDVDFENGDYLEMDGTWAVDFDRHWVQTEEGLIFTETQAPQPQN